VEVEARALGLTVTYDLDGLEAGGAELGVVVAFGRIIPVEVLSSLPMVNLHFSDLPRWRGAAPVERAILAGDDSTAVCLMGLEEGLDTGPVHARVRVDIGDRTAHSLRAEMSEVGARLLVDCLAAGLGEPLAQEGEITYAAKITRDDLRIEWSGDAEFANRQVRVGGAWTTWRGAVVKIIEASVVDGRLRPLIVRPQGRGDIDFESWWRGARPEPGEWFE